ncbi:MAG: nucleotidyltransferase family protein, partial [Hyphomicrobiales bacterium]
LLMVADTDTSLGVSGLGDFTMDANGRLARRAPARVTPFIYAGVCLVSPRLFKAAPARQRFSMNLLWDRALDNGRLFGLLHEGVWMHVGDAVAVAAAEKLISGR